MVFDFYHTQKKQTSSITSTLNGIYVKYTPSKKQALGDFISQTGVQYHHTWYTIPGENGLIERLAIKKVLL
jgi:hypothetical protein